MQRPQRDGIQGLDRVQSGDDHPMVSLVQDNMYQHPSTWNSEDEKWTELGLGLWKLVCNNGTFFNH